MQISLQDAAVTLEQLLPMAGSSVYRLVRVAMVRALEINHGSPPLVKFKSTEKATTIALREIAMGKVGIKNLAQLDEEINNAPDTKAQALQT